MKKIIVPALLLTTLLSLTSALSAKDTSFELKWKQMTPNKINLLVLQQASTATAVSTQAHCYDLTLSGLTPQVLYFADQPSHLVGQMHTPDLVTLWKADKAVHNAGMHAHYLRNGTDTILSIVMTLSKPQYDASKNTLCYAACINDPQQQKVSLPAKLSTVTLFIDPLNTDFG